jgi:hypothetical protein
MQPAAALLLNLGSGILNFSLNGSVTARSAGQWRGSKCRRYGVVNPAAPAVKNCIGATARCVGICRLIERKGRCRATIVPHPASA